MKGKLLILIVVIILVVLYFVLSGSNSTELDDADSIIDSGQKATEENTSVEVVDKELDELELGDLELEFGDLDGDLGDL
tara:strand:- start:212 stop:448 length:237 start_codon:yes stop_codon:yes gene_type:complete